MKAAFVVSMLRFTTWPDESSPRLEICAIGNSEFADAVRRAAHRKNVRNRALAFHVERFPEPGSCDVLLADATQYGFAAPVLKSLVPNPVLTIGSGEGWIDMGGMIQLVVEDRKVRFDTNLAAARQAGVQLSANLLQLSRRIAK